MNGDLHLRIKIGDDEFEAEGTERTVAKAVDVFLDAIGKLPPAGVEDAMTELGGATFHEMSKIMSAQPDENDEVYPEFAENVSSAEAAAPKRRRGHFLKPEVVDLIHALAREGKSNRQIMEETGVSANTVAKYAAHVENRPPPKMGVHSHKNRPEPKPRRRFDEHREPNPDEVTPLADDHPAVTERRTVFPSTVVPAAKSNRALVSGMNSRKIGDRVSKGPWKGMPIFYLTLEERATCPDTCANWTTCYGNTMPFARRHKHGADLEDRIEKELGELQKRYPGGFVVRLHNLGDFYSVGYVFLWEQWLDEYPALRVFGYTAWPVDSEIGAYLFGLSEKRWDRFAIRFSTADPGPKGATTIWRMPDTPTVEEGIVCPAQTGATDCCGSCGLCWAKGARDKCIVFIGHGNGSPGRPPSADSRAEKVTETAVSHDVKTYQYHADFLRVVDWIRMEGIEVTKRNGGKWQPGDRDPMTPRELIEFANRRRENASQMPFRVPHIMA